MKHLHKFASVLLALVMALSLMVPAFAAETEDTPTSNATVTIDEGTNENNLTDHTFTAYQIFTGTQAENGMLGNIQWGDGINGDSFLMALKADSTVGEKFKKATDAASAAVAMATTAESALTAEEIQAVIRIAREHLNVNGTLITEGSATLETGYYLIVDTTENLEGDVYNSSLFQLTDDITIKIKKETTKVEKKVKDTNDSEGTGETGESEWQDSADYDIGDEIPYQLKATLPNNVSNYDTYKLIFNDHLSAGLKYKEGSVEVYLGEEADRVDITDKFAVTSSATEDSTKLTIGCDNVKAITGVTNSSVIVVEYVATLTEDAVMGSTGNKNTVTLTYSNNPNNSGEGDNDTTETPTDTVIVFTFRTIVNKVDPDGNALAGAGFTLNKWNAETEKWELVKEISTGAGDSENQFTFKGLDDGRYQLVESTTPDGYNTMEDLYFKIVAKHDESSDNPNLTELVAYLTDENGTIIKGENETDTELGVIWAEGNVNTGSLTSDVENNRGATLPETGGTGTTIFYIVGGLLTVGAVVLLVTKKRMSVDSDK